ncbi:MAG: hypothetical protein EAZ09_23350 [Oscillatoriales cyanobacterium]|nr:MAG: hypothetical protein EAZ09_23350 [Oscillatoriales cyanobacterium]
MGARKPGFLRKYFKRAHKTSPVIIVEQASCLFLTSFLGDAHRFGKKRGFQESPCVSPVIFKML